MVKHQTTYRARYAFDCKKYNAGYEFIRTIHRTVESKLDALNPALFKRSTEDKRPLSHRFSFIHVYNINRATVVVETIGEHPDTYRSVDIVVESKFRSDIKDLEKTLLSIPGIEKQTRRK